MALLAAGAPAEAPQAQEAVPGDGEQGGRLSHLAALIQHHHRKPERLQAGEGAGSTRHSNHLHLPAVRRKQAGKS